MTQLSKLLRARPPVALLTGTCGPVMERPLMNSLGLDGVRIVRAKTARPEITYWVSPAPPMADRLLPTVVSDWYRSNMSALLLESRSQVLIYVSRKAIGHEVAQNLGVSFFESGTAPEEKLRLYQEFRAGRIQVLVATTAFGAGIDVETVDFVIHAGTPRSLVDFAQESGRAGRGGQPAFSILFRSSARWTSASGPVEGENEMHEWLGRGNTCRREGLALYFDGKRTTCASLPKAKLCDLCRALGSSKPSMEEDMAAQISARKTTETCISRVRKEDDEVLGNLARSTADHPMPQTPLSRPEGTSSLSTLCTSPLSYRESTPVTYVQTPSSMKRGLGSSLLSSEGSMKRRALISAISPNNVSTLKYLPLDPPAIRKASSYSALLLPLLADLKLKKGICFLCLGKGQLQRCDPGECPSEKELVRRDGGTSANVMNTLGDLIKFKLPPIKHCYLCYLPAPADDGANEFHPAGKRGKCFIFASAVPKALTFGSAIWAQEIRIGQREAPEHAPRWLNDVLKHSSMMPEPSRENFARLLLTRCDSGEIWLVRVFFHMMAQALCK